MPVMTKNEVIRCIKRNDHNYYDAITLLSDFLLITKEEAKRIWREEFGEPPAYRNNGRRRKDRGGIT